MKDVNKLRGKLLKRVLVLVLSFLMAFSCINIDTSLTYADSVTYTNDITLYFIDNTKEKWAGNDNATIQLVDNSNGHDYYTMTKLDNNIWYAEVPSTAKNITFNRMNSTGDIQWNSWSAGGRSSNNAYYADGAEYGHWDISEVIVEECFKPGDVVYLDFSEFIDWGNNDSLMYINFGKASKNDNGGNNVIISEANLLNFNPIELTEVVEGEVYKYTFTEKDNNISYLRFWRGNESTLWNNSIILSYKDYASGNNCIKITGWTDSGYVTNYKEIISDKILTANTNEILVEENQNILYLYVNVDDEIYDKESISLYVDGKETGYFYDDGNFDEHGDDIKGDGVYTAKYIFKATENKIDKLNFIAYFSDGTSTNEVSVTLILPFDDDELNAMLHVKNRIANAMKNNPTPEEILNTESQNVQNGGYKDIYDTRTANVTSVLNELSDLGYISEYKYDDVNKNYVCKYANGVTFAIKLDDFFTCSTYGNTDTTTATTDTTDNVYSGYTAIILNTFENNKFRTQFYEELTKKWANKGLDIEYDDFVTVEEVATKLSGKDLIGLSGHGMLFDNDPVFCLIDEESNTVNDTLYADDIRTGRVIPVTYSDGTSSYLLNDDFFEHYYGDEGLAGSFIFSESCMFMGSTESGLDTDIANTMVNDCAGAVVIGFHNSVMAEYSRKLMRSYFEKILSGYTASDAFVFAKEKCGKDDYDYREPSFWEYLFDKDAFEKMGNTAFPLLVGDADAIINKKLKNGDFEKSFFNIPLYWEYDGDVRVLTHLGDIKAKDKKMVFLSTGIGAKLGVGMDEKQGSQLTQAVYNTNNTTLKFEYDVFSEEPMEYVGSRFDDKFEIQILDSDDNVLHSELLETVNTSTWLKVNGIDFEGGDNTMYHTDWKTHSINISAFQNQMIKIRFLVYDVGDSAYDTAVVIDDVKLT